MSIKFLLWENCRFPKLMKDRSLAIVPGHHAHIYHDTYYRRPFWCIAHQYNVACIMKFFYLVHDRMLLMERGVHLAILLVYDRMRIVFLSFPRCYMFNASHRWSIFYFSWSNLTRSLSIRSSVATSIIMHIHFVSIYFLLLFTQVVHSFA